MRVACVLLPDFEVAVELRRHPELAGAPVVVGGLPHERRKVRSRSPEAAASGIEIGMPLRQAQSLCPSARFLPLDESLYREIFDRVVEALGAFSPRVEGAYPASIEKPTAKARRRGVASGLVPDVVRVGHVNPSPTRGDATFSWLSSGPLAVYLDVSGTELLFGPEEQLGRRMVGAVERVAGLRPQVGMAHDGFVARVAATLAEPGGTVAVERGQARAFLAPLPVEHLPCSPEMFRRLHLLGLRTVGPLAALPDGALAEQFGPEGELIARLARGEGERPVVAMEASLPLEEELEMDPPAYRLHHLEAAATRLVERLATRLKSEYAACREVAIWLDLSDGSVFHQGTALHEPTDQAGTLLRAAKRLIVRMVAPSPHPDGDEALSISRIRIALTGLGGHHGEQLGMFRSQADDLKLARRTVREVEEQLGRGMIYSLAEIPDGRTAGLPLRVMADEAGRPRALLLEGRWERVREVSNRWRVVEGWWRREISREYYRVITERDRLCLIFRDLSPSLSGNVGRGALPHRPADAGNAAGPCALPYETRKGNAWFLERIYA